MKMKRILALLLALTLVFALAACGSEPTTSESPSTSEEPSSFPSMTIPDASAEDGYASMAAAYAQQIAGLDKDTVLFTVNGTPVTAEYYLYWLTYDCYYWDYMNLMYYGANLDFSSMATADMTVAAYLKNDAKNFTAYYMVMEEQAAALGCGVTEDQLADWEAQKADYLAQNGQDAFDLLMCQWGVTTSNFDRLNTYNSLYSNLQSALVAEPTEADLDAYIEANNLFAAKHILILTAKESEDGTVTLATGEAIVNEDGSAYTGTAEEYNAKALARIQDIAAQLANAEDATALFDELMKAHSEDSGLTSYPDGYEFTTGEMVTEFEEGTKALAYGEIGEIIQTSYGYHIILRLRPNATEGYYGAKMDALLEQWITEADIVTTEAYDNLDSKSIYANYLVYQTNLTSDTTVDGE